MLELRTAPPCSAQQLCSDHLCCARLGLRVRNSRIQRRTMRIVCLFSSISIFTCGPILDRGQRDPSLSRKSTPMTSPSFAIAELQAGWHTLVDLDRGRAVFNIHRKGTSLRELARKLSCNESLLRRLLKAIQAPVEDQLLARQGTITTNELIRRAKAAGSYASSSRRHCWLNYANGFSPGRNSCCLSTPWPRR
jgi:lambda repressor-like predicted transcriptional regulator